MIFLANLWQFVAFVVKTGTATPIKTVGMNTQHAEFPLATRWTHNERAVNQYPQIDLKPLP